MKNIIIFVLVATLASCASKKITRNLLPFTETDRKRGQFTEAELQSAYFFNEKEVVLKPVLNDEKLGSVDNQGVLNFNSYPEIKIPKNTRGKILSFEEKNVWVIYDEKEEMKGLQILYGPVDDIYVILSILDKKNNKRYVETNGVRNYFESGQDGKLLVDKKFLNGKVYIAKGVK